MSQSCGCVPRPLVYVAGPGFWTTLDCFDISPHCENHWDSYFNYKKNCLFALWSLGVGATAWCSLGLACGCRKKHLLLSGVYAGVIFYHFRATVLHIIHLAIVVNAAADHTFIFQTDPFAHWCLSASHHVLASDKRTLIRPFHFICCTDVCIIYVNMDRLDRYFLGQLLISCKSHQGHAPMGQRFALLR